MKYLPNSFIDSRLYTGPSNINGTGIFTKASIKKDEIVMIWGGVVIPKNNFDESKYRFMSVVPISDDSYLGLPVENTTDSIDEYLNHSCDSNTWMIDDVTVVARRDIEKGEEITLDSCLWDADEDWEYLEEGTCNCKNAFCRKHLSARDFMRPELQKRYAGHFSPYIQSKIEKLSKE